jgi:hypothetical protein
MRAITEKSKVLDANILDNTLPPIDSTINQTKTMVSAPKRAGKNFIQNTSPPNRKISFEMMDVNGGTEINPNAR